MNSSKEQPSRRAVSLLSIVCVIRCLNTVSISGEKKVIILKRNNKGLTIQYNLYIIIQQFVLIYTINCNKIYVNLQVKKIRFV